MSREGYNSEDQVYVDLALKQENTLFASYATYLQDLTAYHLLVGFYG